MPESDRALAVLRQAIHNEVAGQRFYADAALFCIDPWAKETFAALAAEEEEHVRLFLLEFESLRRTGRWVDHREALASRPDLDSARLEATHDEALLELFPAGMPVAEVVDRRSDDRAALALAIDMERRAIDLYRGAGSQSRDPAEQRAYQFLVEEETRHLRQLTAALESIA